MDLSCDFNSPEVNPRPLKEASSTCVRRSRPEILLISNFLRYFCAQKGCKTLANESKIFIFEVALILFSKTFVQSTTSALPTNE